MIRKRSNLGTRQFRRSTIKGRKNFQKLFSTGTFYAGPVFALRICPSGTDTPAQFAVCVSRQLGNAVTRNRLKRITRETADPFSDKITRGVYIAIFPRRRLLDLDSAERRQAYQLILRRSGVLRE
ncbi:MAG: ribonuclease P protein component [Leptospiraceae bacterium]|nr:ribonuclease P protein component [Leptospiraceae bacterium]MCB1319295.1 ribonuclease P protein component [Leptospiraceae bacterium]